MKTHQLTVLIDQETKILTAPEGANLRRTLLEAGISPYARVTRKLNCGGRGLCATCGVFIEEGKPDPSQWHDHLAENFGYPRLSCQIIVSQPMTIRILTDKIIWGKSQKSNNTKRQG